MEVVGRDLQRKVREPSGAAALTWLSEIAIIAP